MDLDGARKLDDQTWVSQEADIPSMERILTVGIDDECSWHPLVSHLKWEDRPMIRAGVILIGKCGFRLAAY